MKQYITAEQAISVLPDGDFVNAFYDLVFGPLGAYWDKKHIMNTLRSSDFIELTEPNKKKRGYGICAYSKDDIEPGAILFIETDKDRLDALEREVEGDESWKN